MKVKVVFDTEIFDEHMRGYFEDYFRRDIKAVELKDRIGWSRELIERHLAGIFSEGNSTIVTEK